VLRIADLTVTAGPRTLFAGVRLDVAPGRFVGLRGPSGCGKTTLLRTLVGLTGTPGGALAMDGRCPGGPDWPALRRRVVLVPQQPVMFVGTVRDNLCRPFRFGGRAASFDEAAAQALLARVQLPDDIVSTDARRLSVGQQQRVALVRALLMRPAVLLLDEPTSALDEAATASIVTLLDHERRERGLAAVIASHNGGLLADVCDPVLDLTKFSAQPVAEPAP
jgi:putative ABC transport system ATP-binding protein